VILFPNCKVNIGLNIVHKRSDGYHDLETVFYPLPLKEVIESLPADEFTFNLSGLPIHDSAGENLCVKAYRLLKNKFPALPGIRLFLHKHIPPGAGLGGGSSDAAHMLCLLNHQFNLNLSKEELMEYALQLGSDCPFFILNKPCFASGRGEKLEPIKLDLSAYAFILVHPGIHISTALSFASVSPAKPAKSIREIIAQPIRSWASELVNDFETPALIKFPALRTIREKLYDSGALYASIFEKHNLANIRFEKNIRVDLLK
jgi:4-diphosphocytidyl-2-C-methyl-D-erythritol kinase